MSDLYGLFPWMAWWAIWWEIYQGFDGTIGGKSEAYMISYRCDVYYPPVRTTQQKQLQSPNRGTDFLRVLHSFSCTEYRVGGMRDPTTSGYPGLSPSYGYAALRARAIRSSFTSLQLRTSEFSTSKEISLIFSSLPSAAATLCGGPHLPGSPFAWGRG